MKTKQSWRVGAVAVLALAVSVSAFAQDNDDHERHELKLSGLINDQTTEAQGAWEIHGEWSLTLKDHSGEAEFSAVLTMERSDLYVLTTGDSNRNPHTHHIRLDGTVVGIGGGFEVSGLADITVNGSPAPLPPPLQLAVDVTGGKELTFSNVKLIFGGGAANHFGTQAINGVVRFIHDDRDR